MTPDGALHDDARLPLLARRGTILVMAIACGVMVGNIYLCQPLLNEMARNFGVPEHAAGFVAVASQVGYAIGILLVVPLGDVAEPRGLLRVLVAAASVGLLGAAVAPGLTALILASLFISASSVVAQVLIPLATSLVPPGRRGRVIGSLQTGLISGILLSRTISGTVATFAGTWRAPYALAAVVTGCLFLVLPRFIPTRTLPETKQKQGYWALLRSLPPLLLAHRSLRISAALGFCVFGAFSAFWATLAFHLASPPFRLGAAATGLFGLWGAPGAILAPIGGRLADRLGPDRVNIGALASVALAFAVAGTFGRTSILALVIAVNLLDFGLQCGQVANQARIFALGAHIRSRLNTIYMVALFGGGACASTAAAVTWSIAGWAGVCTLSAGFIVAAGVVVVVAMAGRNARKR